MSIKICHIVGIQLMHPEVYLELMYLTGCFGFLSFYRTRVMLLNKLEIMINYYNLS